MTIIFNPITVNSVGGVSNAKKTASAIGFQGPQGIPGLNWRGEWSVTTSYVINDAVRYGRSSWRCLLADTGHAPPTLPLEANSYWALVAAKGLVDGYPRFDRFVGANSAGPYTLAHVPMENSEAVEINGIGQTIVDHYNLSGAIITFNDVLTPDDLITVRYLSE